MLVFKENVKGFVFDSSNDEVTKIFDRKLSAEESILIMEVIDEDSVLFENEKSINELFTIESKEDLESDFELSKVLDWKE
jgi:flagellar biogenesis protein FliO